MKRPDSNTVVTQPRHKISSLVSKVLPKVNTKRRLARPTSASSIQPTQILYSSSTSIQITDSIESCHASHKHIYYNYASLTSMPCEILDSIFQHLDQRSLHATVKCNKYLADFAARTLYAHPNFATSYRFAQFVSVVTHNPSLAKCVQTLDLGGMPEHVDADVPMAGWREWRYRNSPLYKIHLDGRERIENYKKAKKALTRRGSHPLPSPLLAQYSLSRDVPVGAVLQVLAACPGISKIDLSCILLTTDYLILPSASKQSTCVPTVSTNLLFSSEVLKAYTWGPEETKMVNSSTDIVDAIIALPRLRCLHIRNGLWVGRGVALKLTTECETLLGVDFRECGKYRAAKWAVKGGRERILELIVEDIEDEKERKRKRKRNVAAVAVG